MRRLLVEKIEGDTVRLTGEPHHRATRVLRLGRGDRLRVFDGGGAEYEAAIASVSRSEALLRIERAVEPVAEPAIAVTLLQAVPRGDAMERVIQKSIEIGVSAIVPVMTRRTVPRIGAAHARDADEPEAVASVKLARWRKIALHAVEQSGRCRLVTIADPVSAEEAPPLLAAAELALVLHGAAATPLRTVLGAAPIPRSVAIAVGPEGGLAEDEVARAIAAGAQPVSLGPRVLRSETAGLAAIALVLYHFGEMG